MNEVEKYIRDYAISIGIDPDVAVRLAKAEGGPNLDPFQQSNVIGPDGQRETSFGPFQLRIGGGLGDEALAAGVDPRKDWQAGVRFALDTASKRGWGAWMAAPKIGLDQWTGIRTAATAKVEDPTDVGGMARGAKMAAQQGAEAPPGTASPSPAAAPVPPPPPMFDTSALNGSPMAMDLASSIRPKSSTSGVQPLTRHQAPILPSFDFASANAPQAAPPAGTLAAPASIDPKSLASLFEIPVIGGADRINAQRPTVDYGLQQPTRRYRRDYG